MTIWAPILGDSNLPKYKQLADAIDAAIVRGELKGNDKLPPQRQLADALGVTVGTVTRGYCEAERRGSVVARVGSGTYVNVAQPESYMAPQPDNTCYDLRSANAPMGLQLDMMAQGLAELAKERQTLTRCLRYQPEVALPQQRQLLADWLSERGLSCSADNVLFSYGGQQSLALALQALCRAGDTVLCEGLSFPGITAACQQQQLRCIGLAMDEFGVTAEALTAAIAQSHPRALYLTAQVQNPTCSQMPLARKQQLAQICRQHGVVILEDDVQFLPLNDKQPSFYSLDPDNTVYLASFSKCFSGGLRVGYLVASTRHREAIRMSLRADCWTVSPLLIELLCRWLANGKMAELEQWLSDEMAARSNIVREMLSGIELQLHPRGFNAWLTLPEPWRAVDFVRYAEQQQVLVRAAESYAVGRMPAPQNIRICFCAPNNRAELREALQRLKQCLTPENAVSELVI